MVTSPRTAPTDASNGKTVAVSDVAASSATSHRDELRWRDFRRIALAQLPTSCAGATSDELRWRNFRRIALAQLRTTPVFDCADRERRLVRLSAPPLRPAHPPRNP